MEARVRDFALQHAPSESSLALLQLLLLHGLPWHQKVLRCHEHQPRHLLGAGRVELDLGERALVVRRARPVAVADDTDEDIALADLPLADRARRVGLGGPVFHLHAVQVFELADRGNDSRPVRPEVLRGRAQEDLEHLSSPAISASARFRWWTAWSATSRPVASPRVAPYEGQKAGPR